MQSTKLAEMLGMGSPVLVVLITGLVGGLVTSVATIKKIWQ